MTNPIYVVEAPKKERRTVTWEEKGRFATLAEAEALAIKLTEDVDPYTEEYGTLKRGYFGHHSRDTWQARISIII